MKTAMILSAGRGERLKPLTDKIPKPLCLLHGKPLIEHHIEHLAKAGFEKIIINHAWLGGKIRAWLGDGQKWNLHILYTPEPPGGLETAGGIINALPLLGKNPFAVINGDIYSDYPLENLNIPEKALANLILIPNNPALNHAGDFGLHNKRVINTDKTYTFSGIACYRPEMFEHMPFDRYSMTPLLRKQVELGAVYGEIYQGVWFDIGSMKRYEHAKTEINNITNRGSPCT